MEQRGPNPIVITTQVPHEGSDLAVLSGRARVSAAQPGILQAYTMTAEAVVTKLMWILPRRAISRQIKAAVLYADCLRFAAL